MNHTGKSIWRLEYMNQKECIFLESHNMRWNRPAPNIGALDSDKASCAPWAALSWRENTIKHLEGNSIRCMVCHVRVEMRSHRGDSPYRSHNNTALLLRRLSLLNQILLSACPSYRFKGFSVFLPGRMLEQLTRDRALKGSIEFQSQVSLRIQFFQ